MRRTPGKSTDEKKNLTPRQLLARALRADGYRKLCKEDPSDYSLGGRRISVNLLLSIMLGLIVYAVIDLRWSLLASVVAILSSLVAFAVLIGYLRFPSRLTYLTYVALWFAAAFAQLVAGDLRGLAVTHALPFGIVLGVRWAISALQLTVHVPFFIPLALIIVLLPLLTEDPWRLSSVAGPRVGLLAAVSALPLAALYVIRLARLSTISVLASAAEVLSKDAEAPGRAFKVLDKLRDKNGEEGIDEDAATAQFGRSYRGPDARTAVTIAASAAKVAFRWRAMRRFLSLLVGIGIAVWFLIYGLAWAAVPTRLAADWSGRRVPFEQYDILGWNLSVPLGPYVLVASLLATVACVGFLGFALTEDQYSEALWRAVVAKPAEDYLLLAMPYASVAGLQTGAEAKSNSRKQRNK